MSNGLNTLIKWAESVVKAIKQRTLVAGRGISIDRRESGTIISVASVGNSVNGGYFYDGPFAIKVKVNDDGEEENILVINAGYVTFSTYVEWIEETEIPKPILSENEVRYIYIRATFDEGTFEINTPEIIITSEVPNVALYEGRILLARVALIDGEFIISQESFGEPHQYIYWVCNE